jgi:hypothetical protein
MIQRRRLDALVVNNDEHRSMVEQLEQIYDAGDDERELGSESPPSTIEMRSADEIAAEVEEYLRGQD